MSFNCHVLIYLPIDSNGNIIRNNSELGHYDLRINNSGYGDMQFNGRSYTDPIFAYGGENGERGTLQIFSASNLAEKYDRTAFKLYSFSFTAEPEAVLALLDSINNNVSLRSHTSMQTTYNVVSGPFATYTTAYKNCFACTAWFCNFLGYTTLWDIYEANNSDSNDYLNYTAWRMFDQYGSHWTYRGTYNL